QAAQAVGVPFAVDHVGGMFGFYFRDTVPTDLSSVSGGDTEAFERFFHACLEQGVYFAPSAFEAGFVSITHDDAVIDATIDVAAQAMRQLATS
ncbi:MAG: aspartate aminotransferase family protein, partial [Pigmentiphaga sp.]